MSNEILSVLTFDPDGDLHLRLTHPPAKPLAEQQHPEGAGTQEGEMMEDVVAGSSESVRKVDMLVSSKYLMLASPVFKAMLQPGRYLEGTKLQSGGATVVDLPEDDPEALKILLSIVHAQTQDLPTEVSLETMTGLSVLVDKYQMYQVGQLCVRLWMPELKKSVPTKLDNTLMSWLSISWVFKLPDVFEQITRIAEHESCGHLAEKVERALPIPDTVLG